MTLTKADLADQLVGRCTVCKAEAKEVIGGFFEELAGALERGEVIKLSRFGKFALREKCARPGRNPKTGEASQITARRVISFVAADELKLVVQRSTCTKTPPAHSTGAGKTPE